MGKSKLVSQETVAQMKEMLRSEVANAERELALAKVAGINVAQEEIELKEAKTKLEKFVQAYG